MRLRNVVIETVGIHHYGNDYVVVCIPGTKNAHSAIPLLLTELPSGLREDARKDGLKFFADVEIEYDDSVPGGELFSFSKVRGQRDR